MMLEGECIKWCMMTDDDDWEELFEEGLSDLIVDNV